MIEADNPRGETIWGFNIFGIYGPPINRRHKKGNARVSAHKASKERFMSWRSKRQ
jgi:hypothetical protein